MPLTSLHCSGNVTIDGDFLIQSGGTLKIETSGKCIIKSLKIMNGGKIEVMASEVLIEGHLNADVNAIMKFKTK